MTLARAAIRVNRALRRMNLYVQQDEARGEQDPDRARELQVEIDKATAQREEIRPWAGRSALRPYVVQSVGPTELQ